MGDARSLDRALGRSEKHMKRFGATSAKTSGLVSSRMKGAAKSAAGLAAGYASIAGAKRAVSTTEDLAKATIGLNKNLGLSVERASEWAAVAKVRGIETKALNMSFGTLAKNSQKAAAGGKAQADAFKRLGVTQKELKSLDFNALLGEAADGMGKLRPGAEKTAIAMQLFGRGWQTVVPVLRDGSKGMQEQLALARKYGATFSGGTVKSMQDFIASQREAKFASLGLQVAFGTKVAPTLTKVINKVSEFVLGMREGTGAGGRFAAKAREVADKVKSIIGPITSFVGKHPGIQKVGIAILGVGVALKALRFASALTGIDKVASGLGMLARTKAGQKMKESIVSGVSGLAGRLRDKLSGTRTAAVSSMSSVGTSAGKAGGGKMATSFTGTATGGITKSARGGRLRGLAGKAGPFAGLGAMIGVAMAVPITQELSSKLSDLFDSLEKNFRGRGKGGNKVADLLNKTKKFLPIIGPLVRREGGMVFSGGGTVPAMLSSGEMGIEPGGRAFMVPGRRVAADNVAAMVRPGTAILTSSGQGMLASGASVSQALRYQAPHFATGGQVAGLAARTGLRGRKLQESVAIAGAESGWNENAVNRNRNGSTDRGLWQINSVHGRLSTFDPVGNARAMSRISGKGSNWRPWVTYKEGTYKGWMGRAARAVKGITGTAGGGVGRSRSLRVTTPAARSFPLLGNILSPLVDDALLGGIEAGRNRTGRLGLLTSVLEGIAPESTDYATSRRETLPGLRGRGRTDRAGLRGGFTPGGGWAGTKNLVMHAIRGISGRRTFKRSRAVNGNQNSDHNPWIKNAFASDISPGSDSQFATIASRLGIGARKGSWNNFANRPVRGFRSQLLWHAPDGSHKDHIHLGIRKMRRGGVVGSYQKGGRVRGGKPRRIQRRKRPRLHGLIRTLAGNPGSERAGRATQTLSGRVRGRSRGALLRARADIQKRIRGMAAHGLTGEERIQVRRLRGALSLIEDELGRPIGLALGGSDETQDIVTRSLGNLENELIVGGIDPESAGGVQARIGRTQSAIGSLAGRRSQLTGALARAKATGNRQAVGQVQAEINEVDDQILGLRADLVNLTKATTDQTDLQRELAEQVTGLRAEMATANAYSKSVDGINARETLRFMGDVLNGQIAGQSAQRFRTAGDGSLARY